MDNLMTTTEMVKELLQTRPETRNSDDILYYHVCAKINPICVNYPFCQIIQNRKSYGLPAFESVRRTRQKIQHDHPELRGDLYLKRMEKQTEFIEKFSEVS